ncbi:MAG TPA: monovalent cation/H+ antiporter subunit A [Burkholderiales bacterium]|nr:monovalent cation/H+ antiporter subunit A [Burkholderiales bacterium]
MNEILLYLLLLLPFAASIVAGTMAPNARNAEAWLSGGVALSGLAITLALYPEMSAGNVVRASIEWAPALGLGFSLRMDGFAWLFSLLVTGIGFLVVLYARYYMSPQDPVPRFFSFFLAFMGSMLGVVLAGNVIQLVFFWELTSLFSFLLIGYWHHNAAARDGARMALVLTSAGGLCLFGGALILGRIAGSYELDAILAAGDRIRADALYVPALALVAAGALTKSAQFPFQFWLPQAMAAPTPVSAYLHSAAMVKLGVFLLARLWPAMAGTDAWMWIIGTAGLVTLVLGAYAAIFQHDLKALLAYSTISHLGLITVLIGLNSPLALVAAVFHITNHATFKASLFMAAGIIDHESGTRDIRRLSGLYRLMPITATLAMVAAAAMAGVPLLNGFLSKEMFFTEALQVEGPVRALNRALPFVATIWGMFSVAYSLRLIHGVFFGPPPAGLPRQPCEPPRWMRFPIELLVLACLLVGVLPAFTIGPILEIAVRALLGTQAPAYSLAVWHGFTTPLAMSLVAMAGGALLYRLLLAHLAGGGTRVPLLPPIEGRRIFNRILLLLSSRWARAMEARLGTGRLQPQLVLLLVVALLACAWPVWKGGLHYGPLLPSPVDPAFVLIWAVGAICALGAAWQAKFHRLAALLLTGAAGIAVCLTFVWLSAPDLALTQLLVEIVTTVLLLLGLRWLPKRLPFTRTRAGAKAALPRRLRDIAIAAGCGGGLGLVSYAVMTRPLPDHAISRFFVENAWSLGGGTNIVNVIIVDFRGFDTLGEITVLGVVAIAVYALMRRFRPAAESVGPLHGQTAAGEDLAIPSVIMRAMFPVTAVVSVYLLLRGHNFPGGGFAAGIAFCIGVILQYMAGGTRWAEDRLALRPLRWITIGLLLAGATGAGSWLFGHPFLTSHVAHFKLPLAGDVHVPTAFFFDLGVFSLVVGATALILIVLAHQSTRAHRPIQH